VIDGHALTPPELIRLDDGRIAVVVDPHLITDAANAVTAPVVDSDALFEEFLTSRTLALATRAKYRAHYEEFREWLRRAEPTRPLALATRKHLIRFLAYATSGRRRAHDSTGRMRQHPLSESAQRSMLACLSGYFRFAVFVEARTDDPTLAIPRPRRPVRPGGTLSDAEVRRLLDAPGSERCRVQAHLLHFTGARAGSLRGLRWPDIDFEHNEITFVEAKGQQAYTVPLHPELKSALLRWRSAQHREAAKRPAIALALADPATAFVLLTREGRPLSHTTIAKQYKWRARRAGVRLHAPGAQVNAENTSSISPHWARRTAGTTLRRQGVDLADVADFLNHASVETTRKHYAFTTTEAQRRAVAKLNF
jgi:site-specific recombinase XerD